MTEPPESTATGRLAGLRRRLPSARTAVVALAAGAAGLAGSYGAVGFTPGFVAAPVASLLAKQMPAAVIQFAIVVLGDLGDKLNLATAVALAWVALSAAALFGIASARRAGAALLAPVNGAAATGGVAFAVTGALDGSLAAAVGAGFVLSVGVAVAALDTRRDVSATRRSLLGAVGTGVAAAAGGYVLGSRANSARTVDATLPVSESVHTEANDLLASAREASLDVDGLEPLVSDDFYNVDINSVDPNPDRENWELSVTGAVEEEQTYTYEDVTSRDAENQFSSLRCVGEPLNGRKLDNALWHGIPIMDLVEPANPSEGCCVMLRAADGFYEEFPLAALEDGFLAFGMNGEVLPRSHGHPARALIPGHWGEINVKWLTEIEILEEEAEGYWEERGWHGTGPVETVAKLHLTEDTEDGRKRVGGHAYAGTRGIERVEVSTDGGETWVDATLSDPLPGDDVWRQWVYEYDPPDETHEVVVRATDGEGTLQPQEETGSFPSGPTGWVSQSVSP